MSPGFAASAPAGDAEVEDGGQRPGFRPAASPWPHFRRPAWCVPHLDVRGRAVGTGGSLCAGRAGRALGPGLTLGSLDALLSLRALSAGRALRASCTLHALWSLRTHNLPRSMVGIDGSSFRQMFRHRCPCIVDVIVRGLVAGVGTQQMPLVGHAEIDHASRLHGHAVDAARSLRPLHALGSFRSRGSNRASSALNALGSLDALMPWTPRSPVSPRSPWMPCLPVLPWGPSCALFSLVALGGDKQPVGTLHASGHVQPGATPLHAALQM